MDKFWERYIQSRPAPGESKGAFEAFAAEHRDPGPRNMAQGGRIGYDDGQLVQNTADGSRPGYGERYNIIRPTTSRDFYPHTNAPKDSKYKISWKKSKAGTLPDEFQGTKFYESKADANAAQKAKQKFIKESREAKKKPYVKPEPKITNYKIGQSTADNVVTKSYKNSATGKITKKYSSKLVPGEFESLEAVTEANKKYRIKNPIKNPPPDLKTLNEQQLKKYLDKQEKAATIKSKGGYYSGPHTGTVKAHLGHTSNIWAPGGKITGDVLAYTPAEINQAMSAEGKD